MFPYEDVCFENGSSANTHIYIPMYMYVNSQMNGVLFNSFQAMLQLKYMQYYVIKNSSQENDNKCDPFAPISCVNKPKNVCMHCNAE